MGLGAMYLKPLSPGQRMELNMPERAMALLVEHVGQFAPHDIAKKAGVGRLVLVHINPLITDDAAIDLVAAKKVFANTEIGVDRMEIEF